MSEPRQNQAEVFVKDLKRIDDDKPLAKKLCEALGLDHLLVAHLQLECSSPSDVWVTARVLLVNEQQDALTTVLRQYKLVPENQAAVNAAPLA